MGRMRRGFKILLAVLIVVGSGYLVARFWRAGRVVKVVWAGQSAQCTLGQSLKSYFSEEIRLSPPIRKTPRLVREEPDGCQLWEIAFARVWVPRGGGKWLGSAGGSRYGRLDLFGEALIHPGDVVLDCGAYMGDSAWEAMELGAKLVISIEPSPRNLACLRRNLEKEIAGGRVIVVDKGVWDREDFLVLEEHEDPTADYIFEAYNPAGKAEGKKVPLTTIDKLVEELKLERVDYIKMDIEGSEQRAIIGAKNTIAKFKPRLAIAAYHLPNDWEKIPELVRSAWPGYKLECERCLLTADGQRIRPHMFYFHQ